MEYRIRSKRDREIEEVINEIMSRITLGKPPDLLSPDSKPGEAVKKLSDEKREVLKKAKTKHFQNYPIKHNKRN